MGVGYSYFTCVDDLLGTSRSEPDCRELVTFFKEIIIRTIIMGTNLAGSEQISHTSLIVGARDTSHRIPPTNRKQRIISKKGPVQLVCIRTTYIIAISRNDGWESGFNG